MPKKVTPQETVIRATSGTAKSPVVKAARTTAPKKVIKAKKTTTVKKKTQKSPITKSPKIEQKLEKLEKLHTAKKQVVPTLSTKVVAKKENKKEKTLPSISRISPVSLLSPYRFPIDVQKLAVATARFSGVFFVALGALFTLLYAESSFSSKSFLANTLTPLTETQLQYPIGTDGTTSTLDCRKPENYLHTLCANSVDTTPLADIVVNNPDELQGSVQVKIKVPFAEYVTLMAFNKTLGTNVTIGTAKKVGSDAWELYWNTTSFEDGSYKLKAVIRNGYGVYEEVDNEYVVVANTVPEEDHEGATSGGLHTTTTTDAVLTEVKTATTTLTTQDVKVGLVVKNDTNSYEYNMEVRVEGAEKVKVYAKKDSTTSRILLGYAYKSSSNLWKYRWLLSNVDPGTYMLTAASLQNGREYLSNSVSVLVPHTTTEATALKTATTTQITETDEDTEADEEGGNLTPSINLSIDGGQPLSGVRTIKVDVDEARSVELYTRPKGSLVQKYLGVATRVDTDVWTYRFDTRRVPNGEYTIFAYVANAFGTYAEDLEGQKVFNEVIATYTEEQQKTITQLQTIAEEEKEVEPLVVPLITRTSTTSQDETVITVDPLASFKESVDEDLQRLATALRTGDQSAIDRAYIRLGELSLQIRSSGITGSEGEDMAYMIDEHIAKAIERTKENVERIEKVIVERTGESATKDSDLDDISDYDEVNIYGTDPFSADTDGDGFTDGAEILSGFDPLDPSPESVVVYESPKETGVVRDDVLSVLSVASATLDEGQESLTKAPALITGKALPNSFVTLYIFSTPVVVTVKTDAEGNWTYRFDKELEDGEHQVYVGVTDNAGKLVAKSSPFTFVKEAQAYTPSSQIAPAVTSAVPETSIASRNMLYLVLSISVVAIGLVLILLGLYLERRQTLKLNEQELKPV